MCVLWCVSACVRVQHCPLFSGAGQEQVVCGPAGGQEECKAVDRPSFGEFGDVAGGGGGARV
jgi:hypothetical protein